jgi:CTP-dependent riboflavin kinase
MDFKDVSADARVRLAAFVRIHKGHRIDIGNMVHEAKNEKALMVAMMQKHEELEKEVSFKGEIITLRKASIRKLRNRIEDPTVPRRVIRWRIR